MDFSFRRQFPLLALFLLALLVAPIAASPGSRIVVYGAASGSHLRLSTNESSIVVKGVMAQAQPQGCRFTNGHHHVAICPLNGAKAIELDMGPSDDFVEVLDRLPFSMTVHLGSGEDRFIGNDEEDICYPEGTRRNRCIGEGGDDVCITGSRNSDCVGGLGDDYCRASTGSDGCWGGPGDDVCYMGPGQDGCHGEAGDDRLYGEHDPDQLYGGEGFDYCDGGLGAGYSHECEAGPRH
jgi:RTX calcium-binding nonapeptide repeat (4 copies)